MHLFLEIRGFFLNVLISSTSEENSPSPEQGRSAVCQKSRHLSANTRHG